MAGIRTFVAVGDSLDDASNIGYSTTGGLNWQIAANPDGLFFGAQGKGIAYGLKQDGSGVFVAVGDSLDDASSIGYSLNGGLNWQIAANPDGLFFGAQGKGIAYGLKQDGSGVFVAVGDSLDNASSIGYSLDGGETWTVASNPDGLFFGGYGSGYAVAYGLNQDGSGVFVAVGISSDDASNIGYSSDGGLNWQVATATDGLFVGGYGGYGVAYGYNLNGSSVFVAVGYSTDNEKMIGYSNTGGQTWQAADNPNGLFFGSNGCYGVAYGYTRDDRGVFVAVGATDNASNNIGFSTNGGQTWQAASNTDGLFQGGSGKGVDFGYTSDNSGVFVAVGDSLDDLSNIGYSFDGGNTWKVASAIDGLFIGERGNAITFSRDLPLSPPPPLPPLTNVFVAVGRSTDDISNIGYSTDGGQNWIVANQNELLGLNQGCYGVAYGSGVFVALFDGYSDATNMGYSLDSGQTWLLASETNGLFGGQYGYGIAYGLKQDGSGVFVAVGNSSDDLSNIGYSTNGGQNWTVSTVTNGLFFGGYGNAVAYGYTSDGSGVFVAVGTSSDASNIGYSTNGGLTWQVADNTDGLFTGSGGEGNAVAYGYNLNGSGVFVAVGYSSDDYKQIGYSNTGGQTWQVADNPNGLFFGRGGYGIAYGYNLNGRGVFVAVGNSDNDASNIGYSLNGGKSWRVSTETDGLFIGGKGKGVTFGYTSDGSGVFVAVGDSLDDLSNIGYSFDGGQTWRVASPGNQDGLFFGDYGNAIAFSIELPLPPPPPLPPLPPLTNVFVAVGRSTDDISNIGYSTDGGQNWIVANQNELLGLNRGGYGVAYGKNLDGSGVFVALVDGYSDATNMGYSLDGGQTWLLASETNGLFGGQYGYGIAYGLKQDGSGVFVAVGNSSDDLSNIGYSTNGGQNWTVSTVTNGLFFGGYGNAVAYGYTSDGSGVFVAVGNSSDDLSNIGFSTNGGVSWQVADNTDGLFTGSGGEGNAVAYGYNLNGSGVFVAVGESSDDEKRIGYSSDGGLTWQAADNPNSLFFGGDGGRGVTYGLNQDGRGVFVAVGGEDNDSNTIGFSLNGGKSWRVSTETDGLFIGGKGKGVTFGYTSDGSGVFVAVGESTDDLSNIGYSFDGGQTWQVASPGNQDGLFFGERGNAITFSRELPLSPPPPLPPLPPLSNVFVAVGRSTDDISNIGYSTDGGQNWIVANQNELLGLNRGGYGVAYGYNLDGSGVFVALVDGYSDATNMGYSLDGGQTWLLASETNGLFGGRAGYGIAYGLKQDGSGVFVAVGNSSNDLSNIGFSLDGGQNWTVSTVTDGLFIGGYGNGVTFGYTSDGSGVFVAVGDSSDDLSNIGYSPDGGLTWQVADNTDGLFTGSGGEGYAVAYGYNLDGTGVFVAVGFASNNGKQIGYSNTGGQTWQVAANPNGLFFGRGGYGIAYGYNLNGRGVFVAVGNSTGDLSNIGYSTNGGQSWTVSTETDGLFIGGYGNGVTFGYTSDGSGVFVAVGDSNDASNIGYSFDGGQTWRVASPGNLDGLFFGNRGNAITFSLELPLSPPPPLPPLPPLSNVFVAVGHSANDLSNIGYSTDGGKNWTVANQNELLGLNQGGYGVAYGKNLDGSGVFVALVDGIGDDANMGYSLDGGQTWQAAFETNGLFTGRYGYGVGYGYTPDGSGVFVAVGNSSDDLSNIGYSLDGGLTWQVATNTDGLFTGSDSSRGRGVAYGYTPDGSRVFVAVGAADNDLKQIGYSSNGGDIWQVASETDGLFFGGYGRGVAYGYTPDGSGVFVAVGKSTNDLSNIGYSTNGGDTWQVSTTTDNLFLGGRGRGVAYGYTPDDRGVFVAVGGGDNDSYRIGYSLDGGKTWQRASATNGLFSGDDGRGRGVAFGYTSNGRGVFVAVGISDVNDAYDIGYSFDGGDTWIIVENSNGLFVDGVGDLGERGGRAVAFSIELPLPPPTPPISNICFPAGTPIKTDQGIFPIEKLKPSRHTINQRAIKHITKTVTQDTHLICFEKNALGPNIPSEKTIMTKDHKVLYEGLSYIPAYQFLTRSNKVKKVPYNGEILYNVLMKNYGTMQVNNLICETLHPDNVIAKLYNNYNEAERPDLVYQLNASLLERDNVKYKAIEQKISKE